jgi:hypothetical protein
MFKNARNYLIDKFGYPKEHAPSYFVECLIYNVPNSHFGPSYQSTFLATIYWLNSTDMSGFICQNGVTPLFGDHITQWRLEHAQEFAATLAALSSNVTL